MSANKHTNRLINEKSPYLLQHAHNPVDWYPWGSEAFARAVSEDKPIFLSIGYSTCHWCHVMERESFEDDEVARLLNKYYIPVKVDREERPDIDSIYMSVCQALTGHGGWPMTIIMTPDAKPFFAGTYFPKHDRMGLPGLITILERINKLWKEDRQQVLKSANSIVSAISSQSTPSGFLDYKALADTGFRLYKQSFDSVYGGFGNAPKFPTPHILLFLLRYWKLTGEKSALQMTEKTLESMRRGGIFDHIGYGFSRYSTDRQWLVPHFEKMLYDNALLAIACIEAYQATGNPSYAKTAEEIFTYVLRDMTSPEGGFYSAEDADSEAEDGHMEEGRFYTWTPDEIRKVLSDDEAGRFMQMFDITPQGNFEGRSIPNTIKANIPGSEIEFVESCRRKLFEYREARHRPFKDDKILTSWNGLMIAALATGGRVLGKSLYTEAAEKAADFILKNLVNEKGRLLSVYRDGPSTVYAYADDYAFLIWGLLELYAATYKPGYLEKALKLNDDFINLFWDSGNGGFFLNGSDSEQLITKPKEVYDGATPSSNSVAAMNLIRLSRLTGKYELEDKAVKTMQCFSSELNNYPAGYSFMLCAMLFLSAQSHEIVIAGEKDKGAGSLLDVLRQEYLPFAVALYYNQANQSLDTIVPFISGYAPAEDNKAAAYVCTNHVCERPVTEANTLYKMLTQ